MAAKTGEEAALLFALHALGGLKLSPSTQEFYPHDEKLMFPIYEKAQSLGIPILFHAGMSWEPQVKAKFGQPIDLKMSPFNSPN